MRAESRFTEYVPAVPKRILMTADAVGGVWTYAMELTQALADQNVQVALATMGAPLSAAQWAEADKHQNLGVFESEFRLEWYDEPWEDVDRAGEWLLDLEQRLRPDVIHLNNYSHGALPFRAPKLVCGHSCVLSWWRAVKRDSAPSSWDRYRQRVTAGLRAADHVVAPSRVMLEDLQRYYGPLPRADVVHNGRHLPIGARPDKEPIVFSAGRVWDEAKNTSLLTSIAGDLPWKVYVAGDTLDPQGRAQPAATGVEYLGRLGGEDLASWLGRTSIYVLPAKYEPFGLSALEAGLCGCALVLGDIPSLREIWGDAALYVSPHDAGALRETIVNLAADESLRNDLASRAHYRALEFTPLAMASGYLAIYSEIARQQEPEFVCVS